MSSKLLTFANLDDVPFRIVPATAPQDPLGVDFPDRSPQVVRLHGNVHDWTVHLDPDGRIRLTIVGFPYLGVNVHGLVIASTDPKDDVLWDVNPRQLQQGFAVTRADDPGVGWTVQPDNSILVSEIVTRPQILQTQLFRYETA